MVFACSVDNEAHDARDHQSVNDRGENGDEPFEACK